MPAMKAIRAAFRTEIICTQPEVAFFAQGTGASKKSGLVIPEALPNGTRCLEGLRAIG